MKVKKRTTKLILSLSLALVMLVSALGIFSFTASAEAASDLTVTIDTGASVTLKDADSDGYYDIGTADELYAFSAATRVGNIKINGELTENIVFNPNVLTEDGELNGDGSDFRVWLPITLGGGTFDGNHKFISGLYLDDSSKNRMGLFYMIKEAVTVKNVGVIDSYFNGNSWIGGVAGSNYGTVENCYSNGTFIGNHVIGGIVGGNYSTIKNCYNMGTVSSNSYNAGGVTAVSEGTVENCYNTGNVSSGEQNAGGVVGTSSGTVKNCYNTGDISSGLHSAGGVVGSNSQSGTLEHCYNTGSVSADYNVGGVIGRNIADGTATNCYYSVGCATDGDGVTQFGIGQKPSGSTTADVTENTPSKTAAWFDSGEICDAVGYHCGADAANGFCDICTYAPAPLNADGYYEISSAGQLFWFAQLVNIEGDTDACAKLTADIDLENRRWYPIGVFNDVVNDNGTVSSENYQYAGTFDGNRHTISNFTAIGNGSQGLVGYANDKALIKNLGVINATVSGWNAGAILAYSGTVKYCYAIDCTVTAYTTVADAAYVCAGAIAGTQSMTVKNSFAYDCEVIVGAGMETEKTVMIAPIGGETVKNSYHCNVTAENGTFRIQNGEISNTAAQFASGIVAYYLGDAWGQTIGRDSYPVFATDDNKVYLVIFCDNSIGYSNVQNEHKSNAYGYCSLCQVKITGASVTLGSDLSINYSVNIMDPEIDLSSVSMRFTFNGNTVTVALDPEKVNGQGHYIFTFSRIAPQCMSDNIKAELLLGETVIASKDEYSVKANAQSLLNSYSDDAELVQLITDMLYYGAASQYYNDYNLENLANADVTGIGTPSEALPTESVKEVITHAETLGEVKFLTANVRFENLNKIKITISSIENATLKVNGEEVALTGTEYYTSGITAIGFDNVYTFELYDGDTLVQTLTYSVSSYVYSMMDKTEDDGATLTKMAELARALYRYGKSAEAYQNAQQ